jgi:hypothetical protein
MSRSLSKTIISQVKEVNKKVNISIQPALVHVSENVQEFRRSVRRFRNLIGKEFTLKEITALSGLINTPDYGDIWVIYFNGGFFGVDTKLYTNHFIRFIYLHELGHLRHYAHTKYLDDEHNADVFAIKNLKKHWPKAENQTQLITELRELNTLAYNTKET